jgi:D-alanyl-D-alanine carboxypeptidase (penicillin-binding protein 5/6)
MPHRPFRTRRAAAFTLAAGLGVLLTGTPATAATPSPTSKLPVCATSLPLPGTLGPLGKAKPHPLPAATSTVGGDLLRQPGLHVTPSAGVPMPPVVPSASWVVADLKTGKVVASCNAHVPFPPASTLKMLTVLTVLPFVPDRRVIYTARPEDANMEGTRVGLVPGSTYSADDLFHGLMLGSGNDAAHALASYGGGEAAFAGRMQVMAHQLGADDTHVVNASGLDEPGQVSSAYDLALIGRAAIADPYIASLTRTTHYQFPGKGATFGPERKRFDIQNQNKLLGAFAGMTGVKTGFTTLARSTFVGTAVRGDHAYVVSVMQSNDGGWRSARTLLNWAFRYGAATTPVGELVDGPPPGPPPSPTLSPSATTTTTTAGAASGGTSALRTVDAASSGLFTLSRDATVALAAGLAAGVIASLLIALRLRRRG